MAIVATGPVCARRSCARPLWKDDLCGRCWRLAHMFGKDTRMFAYHPVDGFSDPSDAVAWPWERWEREAAARGSTVVDALGDAPRDPDG